MRRPRTVRNVLSGHFNEDTILKVAGAAYRFLAWSRDADALKSVLKRASKLRALLDDKRQRVPVACVNAYGMTMIVSTNSCVGTGMGASGAGATQAIGRPSGRAERTAVAGPAQVCRQRLARLIGHGTDASFSTPMGAAVATLALAARIDANLGGTDASGTRKANDAQAFVEAGDVTFDAAYGKGALLLAEIARLGTPTACVRIQGEDIDGAGARQGGARRETIQLGARIPRKLVNYEYDETAGISAQQSMWRLKRHSKWYDLVHIAHNAPRTSLPHCCTANGPHRGCERGDRVGRRCQEARLPVVDLTAERFCHGKIRPPAPRTLPRPVRFGGGRDGRHGPTPKGHWHAPRVTKTYGGGARLRYEGGRFGRQHAGVRPPGRRIGSWFFAGCGRLP